ncbi:MAG: hypothetical protein GEU99_15935 [Luteitalea sp.]|nr:hypothetical protein [Luteitalea sp.]
MMRTAAKFKRYPVPFFVAVVALACTSGLVCVERLLAQQSPGGDAINGHSCTAEAIARVDEGKALAQVLAMDEARRVFEQAVTLDAECALAHWGLAITNLPWPGEAASRLAEARARDELARAIAPRTQQERAHVQALAALFEPAADPFPLRQRAYRDALRRLVEAYPNDDDASVWLALAELSLSTAPGDEAAALAAAAVRDRFGKVPRHAGAAFVLLLAVDDPRADADARAIADVLARTAPTAPGPRHIAARVYQQLGLWAEAARQDEAALALVTTPIGGRLLYGPERRWFIPESLLTSYVELGRFEDAGTLLKTIDAALAHAGRAQEADVVERAHRARTRMRVRLALERQDWSALRKLPRSAFADQDLELVWFAQGLGAARFAFPHQDAEAFAEARAAATELEDVARAAGPSSEAMRRWLLVRAAIAGGQYERDEMTVMLRQAQQIEGELRASGQLPRPLVWADEVAGDLRLQVDEAGKARLRYTDVLSKQPRRARAFLGLARAENALGNQAAARAAYRQFLDVWAQADAGRPELLEARKFLGSTR